MVKMGSKGEEVKTVQRLLKEKGYNLVVDGIFGQGTNNAVRDFQQKNGLSVDGIVGTNTMNKLQNGGVHKAQNKQLSKNFNELEFACKHCGQVIINYDLVDKLQKLRDALGVPITITSAYRCPVHNRNVGGVSNSQHVYGTAVDIVANGIAPSKVANVAETIGFNGIGRYSNFTHVDVRNYRARWNG